MPTTQEKTFTVEAVLKGIHKQDQAKKEMELATGATISLETMYADDMTETPNPTYKLKSSLTAKQIDQLKTTVIQLFKETAVFALMFLKVEERLSTVSRNGEEEWEGKK